MKVVMTVKKGCAAQSNSIQPPMPARDVRGWSSVPPAEICKVPSRNDCATRPSNARRSLSSIEPIPKGLEPDAGEKTARILFGTVTWPFRVPGR